jgi:large subunit ribosomal protein L15
MRLEDLKPDVGARRSRKRIARGNSGKGGTYAGRGRKGQGARTGEGRKPYFEGGQLPFVRRLPFRRGFKRLWKVVYAPINLGDLDERFDGGAEVTAAALAEVGLLRSAAEPYKVLGRGELKKKLTVHAAGFSGAARLAIEGAGGACVLVEEGYVRPGLGRPHQRK